MGPAVEDAPRGLHGCRRYILAPRRHRPASTMVPRVASAAAISLAGAAGRGGSLGADGLRNVLWFDPSGSGHFHSDRRAASGQAFRWLGDDTQHAIARPHSI